MRTIQTCWILSFVIVALIATCLAGVSYAQAPVAVSDVRVEWKEKLSGEGKGKLYMKLYFTANVNGAVARGEGIRAVAECKMGDQTLSDDHGSGLLSELAPGQSKALDYPLFISNPIGSRPENCNLTFKFGKSSKDSVQFASFCVQGSSVVNGSCNGTAAAQPATTPAPAATAPSPSTGGNVPVSVSDVRLEWKEKSTGEGKGKLYMKLYFNANVNRTVARGEEIRAVAECKLSGNVLSDDHGGGLLSELGPGQSKSLDYPIFIGSPLDSRPESCNLTFLFGKTSKDRVQFARFCYNGVGVNSGSCW